MTDHPPEYDSSVRKLSDYLPTFQGLLDLLAIHLETPQESSRIQQAIVESGEGTPSQSLADILTRAGASLGLRLAPIEATRNDVWELVLDGFSVVLLHTDSMPMTGCVYSNPSLGRIDACHVTPVGRKIESITRSELHRQLSNNPSLVFVAQRALSCDPITSHHAPGQNVIERVDTHHHDAHDHASHHSTLSPLRRYLRFIRPDLSDVWSLAIYGIVVSVLELATPLAVEQMVTTIGFASLVQPLIWIAVMLFSLLTLSACLKALQIFVVEILQRRLFVRIVGDLAERLPRLDRVALSGIHGPEMANRFFDVMTIQKSTASLLVEFFALAIQTITGLVLLAVYSPYLLAFDIVLLMSMTILLYLLGRGAVRSAIEESLIKYRIAHWLQDVIGNPIAFQVHGGSGLAVDRANRLTVEYLTARRKHFMVLIRQTLFALVLYAFSISSLLSLGGWLVLNNSLTIGQLVASVSVVALVVGAFAKIGKSLESFYDLMSATDKIGHLIDLTTIDPPRVNAPISGAVDIRIRDLTITSNGRSVIDNTVFDRGARVAVYGEGCCGKTTFLEILAGLRSPEKGHIEIGGYDSREVNRIAEGTLVSLAATPEVFHGTIAENISLHRSAISQIDLRDALQTVELWNEVLSLPKGIDSAIQTGGYPLSQSQLARLMLARAIVSKPSLLLIDETLDRIPPEMRRRIWNRISAPTQPWTLIVVTHDEQLIQQCSHQLPLAQPALKPKSN